MAIKFYRVLKPHSRSFFLTASIIFYSHFSHAQGAGGGSLLTTSLLALAVLLFLVTMVTVADNLINIQAKKSGVNTSGGALSIIPGWNQIFGSPKPVVEGADEVTFLKKGHNILLEGEAEKRFLNRSSNTYAIKPTDFMGISPIPKVLFEVGDEVSAGEVIMFDKKREAIKYVAPVSGEIVAINRGAKRRITEVVILADKDQKHVSLTIPSESSTREELVNFLMESGGWTLLRQRPFDVMPEGDVIPTNIFISTFDTAPLAPDNNFIVNGRGADVQTGVDVLNRLTSGKVFFGLNATETPATEFTNVTGVEKKWFSGKHPAGNVGVQMHHTAPLKNGEVVWYLGVQELIALGALFNNGHMSADRILAITGAEAGQTGYIKTKVGARIQDLMAAGFSSENRRIISGDALSGNMVSTEGFVGYYDDQITVLKEGNEYEMFGWLLPLKPRPTVSGTFPNKLFPDIRFNADTNTHGERRAFVVTGQYESLLPMDIHVQPLMKAILANDYERMEGLGLLELSEEDLALCEFACTSKQPLQKILRQGLDMMREQG